MSKTLIDPIKVREARARIQTQAEAMRKGEAAANSLLWFDEHAKPTEKALKVITTKAHAVASSTAYANDANAYIQRAVEQFADDILAHAIEQAKADFERAEQIRQGGK